MSTERTALPSPALLVGVVAAAILVGVTLAKGLQDADFFWHVTAGGVIVDTGRVPVADPFSFTWQGMPWTPHEWLSEVLIHLVISADGTTGAMILFGLLAGAIPVIHAFNLGRMGTRTLAIGVGLAVGVVVMFPYVTVRPQVISWLLMAVLVWLLMSLRPDRLGRLVLIPILFVLWANLHGLYVVGFGFIGLYALFTLAGRTAMSPQRWWLVGACVAAVAGSMLTPAGPAGLLYPLRYVDAGDWGLANIQEWQSPNFHEAAHWPLLVMVVALVANGGRAAPGWLTALSWVTLAMALVSLRNAPIAAVVAMPVLAIGISARLASARIHTSRIARRRRILETAIAALIIAASLFILVPRDLDAASSEAIAERYPVAALDLLTREDPDARVLADYGWGGFVINRLHPTGGTVFVDGRNDMYGDAILEEYSTVRAAQDGWEEIVDRYDVDAILFPPDAPIVRGFAQDAGWCERVEDEVQVMLLRSCP